jgi:hypothetical protein
MYNPNQRNHLDEWSKKRKFSKVVSSLFGALKKWRDDEKAEVKEKIILPSKNWEKVVISRSNWDLVLWVIVGMKNWKYCVHYQVWNTYHTKQLSRDEVENNQKMFKCEEYKSSVKDGPDYKLWEEVIIPRTNKQPSKAYITWYIPEKWLYMVWFTDTFVREGYTTLHSSWKTEKTGIMKITTTEQYHKLLTKEDLAKYN